MFPSVVSDAQSRRKIPKKWDTRTSERFCQKLNPREILSAMQTRKRGRDSFVALPILGFMEVRLLRGTKLAVAGIKLL